MLKANNKTNSCGFTLVELSIVIIIIGFLIAGIIGGQALLNQARLTSVISDLQGFKTSYLNFVAQYNKVPGDMNNAPSYWPTGANGCALNVDSECTGNGDGLIQYGNYFGNSSYQQTATDETASAWRELYLAKMITQNIAPVNTSVSNAVIVGTTHPASKVSGAGYIMVGPATTYGNWAAGTSSSANSPWVVGVSWASIPFSLNDSLTNAVFIATPSSDYGLGAGALLPDDAFNMDQKIDDGSIDASGNAIGALTGGFRSTPGTTPDNPGLCTIGPNNNLNNQYIIGGSGNGCISGIAMNK